MMKTKRIVSFILCIVLSISCLSVVAFACTLYKSSIVLRNIETNCYNNAGSLLYTTYSLGTNSHPTYPYSEYYKGILHSGSLVKTGYASGGTIRSQTPTGCTITTAWIGYYSGYISAPSHPE